MATPELRGIKIPNPRFRLSELSPELLQVNGYKSLQTFFPTLTKLFRIAKWTAGSEIWMDTKWRVTAIDCSGTSGPCDVKLAENVDAASGPASGTASGPAIKKVFMKVTHLLDPIHWIQGKYALPPRAGLPWHHRSWMSTWQKLQDPGNQAYIETICSYALGKIREEGLSPHFNIFYGGFCALANTYRYNLTDDYNSYRHERWLWTGLKRGVFKFKVQYADDSDNSVTQEELDELLKEYSSDEESGDTGVGDADAISLDGGAVAELELTTGDLEEVTLEEFTDEKVIIRKPASRGSHSGSTADSSYSDSGSSYDLPYKIYAEIQNYPVMLILTEKNEGTMDQLFDDAREVGAAPGSPEWEARWAAWIFQVVAALSCAQTLLGLTHNDLHTNNIVWVNTEETHINYKTRDDTHFRVPTYGKIFRIIDFGRAIFTINSHMFISDDFKTGNDAEGQYAFKPLVQKFEKEIRPNPSFDLCRLVVSMIDGIFKVKPAVRRGKGVLSKEPGLEVHETESDLYNLLWAMLIDDKGRNVFIKPNGSERFPGFDLYKHIAAHVHVAVPSQQIFHPAFKSYKLSKKPKADVKVYSLFT